MRFSSFWKGRVHLKYRSTLKIPKSGAKCHNNICFINREIRSMIHLLCDTLETFLWSPLSSNLYVAFNKLLPLNSLNWSNNMRPVQRDLNFKFFLTNVFLAMFNVTANPQHKFPKHALVIMLPFPTAATFLTNCFENNFQQIEVYPRSWQCIAKWSRNLCGFQLNWQFIAFTAS